ncbi:MAG TPA: lipoyl domain-containing protein [Candidatus Dormibacteraeota bacterium]|nr:lipoyl domain-containing protein [Candidatus Dormibacteraeota bacterium]
MPERRLVPVTVPRWGLTMEDGVVQEWMVGEGEEVREREVLVTIETDKAVGEVESPASGRVARIVAPEGTGVRPGELLAEIEVTE